MASAPTLGGSVRLPQLPSPIFVGRRQKRSDARKLVRAFRARFRLEARLGGNGIARAESEEPPTGNTSCSISFRKFQRISHGFQILSKNFQKISKNFSTNRAFSPTYDRNRGIGAERAFFFALPPIAPISTRLRSIFACNRDLCSMGFRTYNERSLRNCQGLCFRALFQHEWISVDLASMAKGPLPELLLPELPCSRRSLASQHDPTE